MIKKENYPNAYKEVYVILNNMDKEDVKLIPKEFMDIIEKNMNRKYGFKLDENKTFEEQELLKETKVILSYIFLNFWATNKQKEIIKRKFSQDIKGC